MKQLILIEGLPGTGKTTISGWLSQILEEKGEEVTLLLEGDSRIPCDFYETAGMPEDIFEKVCLEYPENAGILRSKCLTYKGYCFLRIDDCPEMVQESLRRWDMGEEMNQSITVEEYIPCALARLEAWGSTADTEKGIFIIDSGFLQNPVNELLFRGASDLQVEGFIKEIAERIQPLNPLCIYLYRKDAVTAMEYAISAKGAEWEKRIQELLQQLHCENHFEHRYELERKILKKNPVPWIGCPVAGSDWSRAKDLIEEYINGTR